MSAEPYDHPIAVLVGLRGFERIERIQVPPPLEYFVPIWPKLQLVPTDDVPQFTPIPRRVFRLRGRTSTYRWWNVYNEGRSRTPEDGFLYLEQPADPEQTP